MDYCVSLSLLLDFHRFCPVLLDLLLFVFRRGADLMDFLTSLNIRIHQSYHF
jgi:hypothetical protein